MKTVKQNVYQVEYLLCCSTERILVEADSIIEAIEVAKSYYAELKDCDIEGVHRYSPVIKKSTKTITVNL